MSTAEIWMTEALKEAELAISEGEVPVGAVFVSHKIENGVFDLSSGSIVSRGHNLTNKTRNVWKYYLTTYSNDLFGVCLILTRTIIEFLNKRV